MGSGISSKFPSIFKINENNQSILSNYCIGCIIGKGGFGTIKEIKQYKTKKWYALKEYNLENNYHIENMIKNELKTFKLLSNSFPFIIQLFSAFYEHNSVYFILELLSGGDLRMLIKTNHNFNERQVGYIISCIGLALHYLHCNNIIHRDVKLENIMLNSQGIPKLIDFGISHHFPSSSNPPICRLKSGTNEYLAPEVLVPATHYHSYESDFWSLGVVMYELLFYKRPYQKTLPTQMILYSQSTYHSMWLYYLSKSDWNNSKSTIIENSSTDSTDFVQCISQQPHHQHHQQKQTIIKSTSLNLTDSNNSLISQILSQINSTPLDPTLVFRIPRSTFVGELVSTECQDMLLSLLDVRIHKRIGVNERFDDFIEHSWFKSIQLPINQIEELPSPIYINTESIGNYIWDKYSKFDLVSSIVYSDENQIAIGQDNLIDFSGYDLPYIAKEF